MDQHRRQLYVLCISVLPLMVCTGIVYTILSIYLVDELEFNPGITNLIWDASAVPSWMYYITSYQNKSEIIKVVKLP